MTFEIDGADVEAARRAGRNLDALVAYLDVLRREPPHRTLLRPCTLGDGVHRVDPLEFDSLEDRARAAAASGRLSCFVPASGAASRMFADLVWLRAEGFRARHDVPADRAASWEPGLRAIDALDDLAVGRVVAARDLGAVLDALIDDLALHRAPKGLVPFHIVDGGVRTAVAEQIDEARDLGGGASIAVHFTAPPGGAGAFRDEARRVAPGAPVTVSEQDPATDTVAVDRDGLPIRDDAGGLVWRPGGHGALLVNLEACAGDVVFVQNVDSAVHPRVRAEVVPWRRRLVGRYLEVEAQVHRALRDLEGGRSQAAQALARALHRDTGDLVDALHRPLRVVGVVPNRGWVGGGPFFVAEAPGPQIVEHAEVDADDPVQAAMWRRATHFNPVQLVCGLRDHRGVPFDLDRFADPAAFIVTRKPFGARTVTALEQPGLWNGGMAHWNTVLVEIPAVTFQPVKVLADLLGNGHRP